MAGFGDINYGMGASNAQGAYMQNMQQPQAPGLAPNAGAGVAGMAGPQTTAGTGLGFNLGTGQLILGGVSAIANMWSAWQAQKLAKEQFAFQKGITNTNLANQIQSYNTSLTDRITSRSHMQGDDAAVTDQYIEDNKMRDERKG